MENFIQKIKIDKVRHLSDIEITLSDSERKHLILTGKNGSGKTSVLESLKSFLSMYPEGRVFSHFHKEIAAYKAIIKMEQDDLGIRDAKRYLKTLETDHQNKTQDIQVQVPDELETHLHLDLQKKIFLFLTRFFPKIQFIVTTHSPFVLNSAENAVVYDLENRIEVPKGLQNATYSSIVERYF